MRNAFAYVGLLSVSVVITVSFAVLLVWAGCGKDVAR